jgi:hypothetical protein
MEFRPHALTPPVPTLPSPPAGTTHRTADSSTSADLGGTAWILVRFQGGDETVLTPLEDIVWRALAARGTEGDTAHQVEIRVRSR